MSNLEEYINKTPNEVDPSVGSLLLAAPMMGDFNFSRTCVLILDRNPDGSHMGLVLNRELDLPVNKLIPNWPGAEPMNMYNGGPVDLERMFLLHRLGKQIDGSLEIMPGLYSGGDTDQLYEYIASGVPVKDNIRLFVGYAGWDTEQLTTEILQNSWAVNPEPDIKRIFTTPSGEMWKREVEALGPDYRSWLNVPAHPSLN